MDRIAGDKDSRIVENIDIDGKPFPCWHKTSEWWPKFSFEVWIWAPGFPYPKVGFMDDKNQWWVKVAHHGVEKCFVTHWCKVSIHGYLPVPPPIEKKEEGQQRYEQSFEEKKNAATTKPNEEGNSMCPTYQTQATNNQQEGQELLRRASLNSTSPMSSEIQRPQHSSIFGAQSAVLQQLLEKAITSQEDTLECIRTCMSCLSAPPELVRELASISSRIYSLKVDIELLLRINLQKKSSS